MSDVSTFFCVWLIDRYLARIFIISHSLLSYALPSNALDVIVRCAFVRNPLPAVLSNVVLKRTDFTYVLYQDSYIEKMVLYKTVTVRSSWWKHTICEIPLLAFPRAFARYLTHFILIFSFCYTNVRWKHVTPITNFIFLS